MDASDSPIWMECGYCGFRFEGAIQKVNADFDRHILEHSQPKQSDSQEKIIPINSSALAEFPQRSGQVDI